MQILLVEDNPGDARLIQECFRENPYSEKFDILNFRSLSQSIEYLSNSSSPSIDVLLLDLGLPDSLGLTTLKKIQTYSKDIPIIVLTGMDDGFVALQAVKEGAQDYLIKGQLTGELLIKSILYSVERKKVEELKYQNTLVEEANRKKSEFLTMISHEIRNPLGVIIGCSELLFKSSDSIENFMNHATTIRANANHLNELINDILDISRIEAGRIEIEKSLFNLNEEMQITCEGLKKQAALKNLQLFISFDKSVPEFINSDRTRLRQVIYNLVGNSIKFTSQGHISINIQMNKLTNMLEILVQDTGCGIDINDQAHLFQPFSQANKSIYRQYKGTGLGLNLSQKIAQCLGGDLRLQESIPNKGSSFLLTIEPGIPAQAISITNFNLNSDVEINVATAVTSSANEAEPNCRTKQKNVELNNSSYLFNSSHTSNPTKTSSASSTPITSNSPRGSRLQGLNILLADDDFSMRELQKDILISEGASVILVENGMQVISELQGAIPNLIFMDIHMPKLSGYEAVKAIKSKGIHCPVIALTGKNSLDEKKKCLDSGYDDFLPKPFRIESLIQLALKWSQ